MLPHTGVDSYRRGGCDSAVQFYTTPGFRIIAMMQATVTIIAIAVAYRPRTSMKHCLQIKQHQQNVHFTYPFLYSCRKRSDILVLLEEFIKRCLGIVKKLAP